MKNLYLPAAALLLCVACNKQDELVTPETPTPTPQRIVEALPAAINSDLTLDASKDYSLNGQLYVKNNATLTIPAGVTVYMAVKDDRNEKSSLIITQGAKLNVNGTADKPVVFTSAAATKAPGDWGAIVILGKAPTNIGSGNANGLPASDDTKFGGSISNDNSGSIQYLRLEYSGGINAASEEEWGNDKVSGFSLASVGSGTTIHHVMVTHSRDDAFQFVGGTVNVTHLVAYNNGDDDFDFDYGYTGKMQFLISYRSEQTSAHALRANALESYNDAVPTTNAPLTRPVISNMTIIGPQGNETTRTTLNQAVYIRKGTRFVLENSIIAEYPQGGLMVCPRTRPPLLQNNGSIFRYNLVHSDSAHKAFSYDRAWDAGGFTGILGDPEMRDYALNSVNQNQQVMAATDLRLTGMYNAQAPDLTPAAGSPALSGAVFTDADFTSFFTVVPYKGAVGSTNWAAAGSWAVWR